MPSVLHEVKEERMEREKWQQVRHLDSKLSFGSVMSQARMLYERFQAEERLKLRKERIRPLCRTGNMLDRLISTKNGRYMAHKL